MSLREKSNPSDDQILACIDRGLDRVGPNVKYLVYWHLQKIGHLKRADIPNHSQKFVAALRGLYRESAICVERAIVQEINASFGLTFSSTEIVKAIEQARQKMECISLN
jgi:hypothetical protein